MNVQQLEVFLTTINEQLKQLEKIAEITGENFNIFEVLNLQSAETSLHSKLIAELVDPDGSHGQGTKFLDLFIKELKVENFNSQTAQVSIEKYISLINEDKTEGGRIDILIEDDEKNRIIIENKIYAADQEKQLLRYFNFDNDASLFYLTLEGAESTEASTDGKLKENSDYKLLSYKKNIVHWLENCRKEVVVFPTLREIITQYILLIKILTKQTRFDAMNIEIKKMILDNPEISEAIETSYHTLGELENESKIKFMEELTSAFNKQTNIYHLKNGMTLHINCREEKDYGLFFEYDLKTGEMLPANSKTFLKFRELLKNIEEQKIQTSDYYIGWFNPYPFGKNERFENKATKFKIKLLSDKKYMDEIIGNMIQEEREIRKTFINSIENELLNPKGVE